MLVLMAVTLYTSRVILKELGVEQYGIWNLIAGIVVLFSFVQNAMATAIQRFISYKIGEGRIEQTYKIFYNSRTIHLVISLIFFLLADTVGLFFLVRYLNIPDYLFRETIILYQIIILNTIFLILRIPFNSWVIAHEKMSFFSVNSVIEGFLLLIIVFLIPFLPGSKLINYGLLTVGVSLIINIWYSLYCHKIWGLKEFRIERDNNYLKELMSFSSYTMLGSVATIGANQGVNLLINIFYGVLLNAAMGISQQVNGAIVKFIYNFQTAFKPQIVKYYSSNQKDQLERLIYLSSSASFYLMLVLACPILVNLDFILNLWLTEVPLFCKELCILMIICSLIECITSPLWITIQATGKIKKYQITISITYLLTVLLTGIVFYFGGAVYYAIVCKLIIDILVLIERIWFSNKLFNLNVRKFAIGNLLKFAIVGALSFFACFLQNHLWQNYTLIDHFGSILIEVVICLAIITLVGLSKQELNQLKKTVLRK